MDKRRRDRKGEELAKSRTLNPHPEAVQDGEFASSEFFDPADLVQVKYEMVRRVTIDGVAVSAAARSFGFSRQAYYTTAAALAAGGLPALVPAKPGPRRAHKLSEPVLDHLQAALAADPALRSSQLSQEVADRFGISVHPRSVERALARREPTRSQKSG
jgi:transposase